MAATATMGQQAADVQKTQPEAAERVLTDDLDARACKAAARFLELRGYEIVDRDWPDGEGAIDLVCLDRETLVFVEVTTSSGSLPSEEQVKAKRAMFEAIAIAYLAENECRDTPVRFDSICIVPVGKDRAFLRHHVDALGTM